MSPSLIVVLIVMIAVTIWVLTQGAPPREPYPGANHRGLHHVIIAGERIPYSRKHYATTGLVLLEGVDITGGDIFYTKYIPPAGGVRFRSMFLSDCKSKFLTTYGYDPRPKGFVVNADGECWVKRWANKNKIQRNNIRYDPRYITLLPAEMVKFGKIKNEDFTM